MMRRDIYLEDIRTYAAAYGNVYSGEASATVDTVFNVDQFTNRDLVGGFGKTVTAKASGFGSDVKGGNTVAGPDSETKLVPAGAYKFNLNFFVAADSSGLASAEASLGSAGFDLVVTPEPTSLWLLITGILLVGAGSWSKRKRAPK